MEDNKHIISSVSPEFKGVVHVQAHRNGELIYDHTQNNLWLDNGTKQFGTGWVTARSNPYLCISSNTVQPQYTDTAIPSVLTATQHGPTAESSYRRWKFQVAFAAPTTTRTINTVGISSASNGTGAYCYTVLTTPLVQDTVTTVTVFYYVYVNIPTENLGYGMAINDRFYTQLFTTSTSYNNIRLQSGEFVGKIRADEDNWTQYYRGWGNGVLANGTSTDTTNDANHYRYTMANKGLGSAADLTSWTKIHTSYYSSAWTGIVSMYPAMQPLMPFDFDTLGRIWGKKNASSSIIYDNSNETTGYMKAFAIRAPSYPYTHESQTGVNSTYSFYPVTNGAVGTAKYRMLKSDSRLHNECGPFVPGGNGLRPLAMSIQVYKNKFGGRNVAAIDFMNYTSSNSYANGRGSMLYNLDSGGTLSPDRWKLTISSRRGYFVYDNIPEFNNRLYLIDVTKTDTVTDFPDTAKTIVKIESSDSTVYTNKISETVVGTAPSKIYHAIFDNTSKMMLLYYRETGIIGYWDPTTLQFTDSFVNPNNVNIQTNSYLNTTRSWGYYDEVNKLLYMGSTAGIQIFDLSGTNPALNSFNGVADFTKSSPRDWGDANFGGSNGTVKYENGKCYIVPHGGRDDTAAQLKASTTNQNHLSQIVKDGAFEVTTFLSTFNKRNSSASAGLFLQAYPLSSSLTGGYIALERRQNTTDNNFVIRFMQATAGTENQNVATASLLTLPAKGSSLNITANGSFNTTYGTNSSNILNASDSTYASSASTMTGAFQFTNPTVVNRLEFYSNGIYGNNTWNMVNTFTLYGSNNPASGWTTLTSGDIYTYNIASERKTFCFDNSTAYTYYQVSYPGNSGYAPKVSFYYDDDSLHAAANYPVRFKIVRDASDLVSMYYSTDAIATSDAAATWTQLGTSFTLAGRVNVGMFAGYNKGGYYSNAEFSEFRMNNGVSNIETRANNIKILNGFYSENINGHSYNVRCVNPVRANSNAGGCILPLDNKWHVLTNGGVVELDSNFNYVNSNMFISTTSTPAFNYYGCFSKGVDDDTYAIALYQAASPSYSRYDPQNYLSSQSSTWQGDRQYYFKSLFVYDTTTNTNWVKTLIPYGDSAYQSNSIECAVVYKRKIFSICPFSLNWVNSGNGDAKYQHAIMFDHAYYDWDDANSKWIRVNYDTTVWNGKTTHADYQSTPFGLQVKCVNRPSNANTTFSTDDRYDISAVKGGIFKDNQQYLSSGLQCSWYYANAKEINETYTSPGQTINLTAKTTYAPTWITADFATPFAYVQIVDPTTNAPLYFNDVLAGPLAISAVTSQSEFVSSAVNLAKGYNYYFGAYIKVGTETRKILSYDSDTKTFVTETFTTPLTTSSTFSIVSPANATSQGTAPTAGQDNKYNVNESTGVLSVSPTDGTKKVIVRYVAVLRSW